MFYCGFVAFGDTVRRKHHFGESDVIFRLTTRIICSTGEAQGFGRVSVRGGRVFSCGCRHAKTFGTLEVPRTQREEPFPAKLCAGVQQLLPALLRSLMRMKMKMKMKMSCCKEPPLFCRERRKGGRLGSPPSPGQDNRKENVSHLKKNTLLESAAACINNINHNF